MVPIWYDNSPVSAAELVTADLATPELPSHPLSFLLREPSFDSNRQGSLASSIFARSGSRYHFLSNSHWTNALHLLLMLQLSMREAIIRLYLASSRFSYCYSLVPVRCSRHRATLPQVYEYSLGSFSRPIPLLSTQPRDRRLHYTIESYSASPNKTHCKQHPACSKHFGTLPSPRYCVTRLSRDTRTHNAKATIC